MLVSIIIPTYNRAHLIGETLDSVLAQTYENWECIIVDDGSTDNTDEVVGGYIAKDSRFQYHHRPKKNKSGGNGARNYGFELCKGEYVNWFDSDDLMLEDFLQNAIDSLMNKKLDFVLFDYKVFSKEVNNISYFQKNYSQNLIEDYVTFKINFGTWAFVWKRSLVANIEFNENLVKAQDLDFNFRVLTTKNYKHEILNKYGLLLRVHENSIVQDYKKNNINSAMSELYSRKNVFIYMIKKSQSTSVKNKCFELYMDPFTKILRRKEYFFLLKEIFSLVLIDKKIFLKNFWWSLKASLYLLSNFVFQKGEYKFKNLMLKFKYNC